MKKILASSLLVITSLTVLTGCGPSRIIKEIHDRIDDIWKKFNSKEEIAKDYERQSQNPWVND